MVDGPSDQQVMRRMGRPRKRGDAKQGGGLTARAPSLWKGLEKGHEGEEGPTSQPTGAQRPGQQPKNQVSYFHESS